MGNSGWGRSDDRPYFFLSYARTPHDQGGETDPDYWVGQLFRDLSQRLREKLGLPPGANPGFMDTEVGPGNEWPAKLARALATCRVFVPLYSRRYFASVHCGKEWSAFTRRMDHYPGRDSDAKRFIVPALWVPVRDPFPEKAARYRPADFGDTYADQGFYGIMKLVRYRDEYDTAVQQLADQIVDAGTETDGRRPLPPEPEPHEQPENAFGSAHATGDGERRVLVALAEGRRGDQKAPGWKPYDLMSRPLAEVVADLATDLGYLPTVGGLAEHADELISQTPPTRAVVLVVDLWAAMDPEFREILRQIDGPNRPWINVMVVWNPKDPKTIAEEAQLRKALAAALPGLMEGRATSQLAIKGLPNLEDFGALAPAVFRAAERSYLRYAHAPGAHDPAGK
jgi:FxsC-like protein